MYHHHLLPPLWENVMEIEVARTKVCAGCKEELSVDLFWNDKSKHDGKARLCKECDRAKRRKYPHIAADPHKRMRRQAARQAARIGEISFPQQFACQVCGNQASEWHHWSYQEQYEKDVIPLCTGCHRRLHMGYFVLNLDKVLHVTPHYTGEGGAV